MNEEEWLVPKHARLATGYMAGKASIIPEPTFTLTLTAQEAFVLYCIAGMSLPAELQKAYDGMQPRLRNDARLSSDILDHLKLIGGAFYPAAHVHSRVLYEPTGRWLQGLRLESVPQPEPPKRLIHVDDWQDRR